MIVTREEERNVIAAARANGWPKVTIGRATLGPGEARWYGVMKMDAATLRRFRRALDYPR